MNDLNPVLYDPGVELSEIVTATFARFMPASILSAFSIFLVRAVVTGSGIPEEIIQLPLLAALLTAGFGVGLMVLRRFLRPDADVGGGLSVIAGVISPFTYGVVAFVLSQFSALRGPVLIAVALSALLLVGAFLAVIMFFPWLASSTESRKVRPPQNGEPPWQSTKT